MLREVGGGIDDLAHLRVDGLELLFAHLCVELDGQRTVSARCLEAEEASQHKPGEAEQADDMTVIVARLR